MEDGRKLYNSIAKLKNSDAFRYFDVFEQINP